MYHCSHDEESTGNSCVIFAHQSEWQKRMLCRYGNEVTLMDATYNTNIYDMPLFVLSVPTNVGYVVVASILLTNEEKASFDAAIRLIAEWNPDWKPRYAMSDFNMAQISAFETVFPGRFYFQICFLCNTKIMQ